MHARPERENLCAAKACSKRPMSAALKAIAGSGNGSATFDFDLLAFGCSSGIQPLIEGHCRG